MSPTSRSAGIPTPIASRRRVTLLSGDSRWRRGARRLGVTVCLLLIAAMIAAVPAYARPQIDELRHADAVLILGGFGDSRYSFGLDLAAKGWAPSLLVSNPRSAHRVWERNYCATPPPGIDVHCFVPDPQTTRGEGRELRRMASQYGWRTVIVVTMRPHISRARFILEQCFNGDLIMVASPTHISAPRFAYETLYQTAGYLRALLQPGC